MQNYKGTNMSVSESEKLGMTGAGCRFIEKVEHVPIKKRWFLFGSPSPPPITQSTEEPEGLQNIQHKSCQNFNMNSTIGSEKKASDATTTSADINGTGVDDKKTHDQGDNQCISGISVLATVACNNNSSGEYVSGGPVVAGMHKVPVKTEPAETKISTNLLSDQQPCSSIVLHAPVKTELHDGSSYLPIPVISSQGPRFDTIHTLLKDHTLENVNHDASHNVNHDVSQNVNHDASQNVISGSHNISNRDDSDETVRDGRLHWDLNTAMDAWDRPLDGDEPINDNNIVDRRLTNVPSSIVSVTPKNEAKCSVSNTTLDVCDFPRKIGGDANNSSVERALAPLEFKSLSVEPQGTEVKELKLDTKNIVISKENSSAEIKKTNSVFDKDRSDALPMPLFASTHTSVHVQETINPRASQLAASDSYVAPSISFGANTESHPSDACERVQPIVSVDKTIYCTDANIIGQEQNNPALSDLSVHDKQTFNKERLEEDGYNHNDIHASELRMDYDSQYEDGELRESSIHDWEEDDGEDLDIDHVDYGSDNRDTNNMDSENTECNSQVQPGGGSFRSGVVDVGYLQDDTAAAASSTAGLSAHCPVDQVDASKGSGSIADDQAIGDDDKGDVSQMNAAEIETDKDIDLKARTSGWDLMPPISCRNSSDMVSGGGGTRFRNTEKDAFSYKRDRSEAENKERKSFDSGVNNNNRSEIFSRIERPASGRVFLGKDRLGPRGDSSIEDDSFFRSEREFGGVRPFGRGGRYHHPLQRGGRGDNLWGNDSAPGYERGGGMKRMRSSPGYHHGGMGSTRHPGGPGDVVSDGRRVNSRRYNNGRNGSPPDDRNDNNYMHRGGGIRSGGGVEMSPDRCIGVGRGGGGRGRGGRSGARYGGPPQIDGGGPRGGGRYHHNNNAGAIENDNVESSSMNNNSYMHPLSVRGGGRRSFSPPPERRGGNNNQFGPKSHMGSRARSPDAGWQPRNMGFRNRNSRSPNFRPRGGRSSPFSSRPDFVGEQESGGFAGGPSMDRDSPQTSKWMNYKQQRGGGGRAWGNDEMMESNNSRKMNNNEYGRSVYPTRQHSDFNGVGRGGGRPRYDVSDDNRKEYRFRHGGGLKRFRYNEVGGEEDDFGNNSREKEGGMVEFHRRTATTVPNNNVGAAAAAAAAYHEKGGGGGEAGRRSSGEERGHFLQRQERKYNNNKSVVVGMQESDDDMAAAPPPRRRIW
ncbi:sericin 1-like [Impatiens glandulifera]|uniref:sericin 1-like n=1 Tax=Impatiens glandulifera TaxID=253017 RepID=UPI001FB05F28|nr:sericin 1-like [Impatiens glandulifera]XP_047317113.1 sericin 1-like [Impatiens glandulifera]